MPTDNLNNARILIVDDEPTNLKLVDRMLRGQGYTNLVLIQDPREVVDRFNEAPTDLILLDINMPNIDGFEVMKQLKALQRPLMPPIIILTAQSGRDILLRSLAEGARDFISKPFDRIELIMRVRNLLEAHQAHRLLHDQKAMLQDMVRNRTEELRATRLQVVQRLGQAAEYRDNETGCHILRMSHASAAILKHMGGNEEECTLMLHASPMHDIGKIGIPDAILLKPGKLDPDEWEVMKKHATIGAKLLDGDNSELLTMARSIALGHHEKWDGSGYPYGLKGEEIPKAARIVAVADVFDALTSERPYKKAWPINEALTYINEQSGKHFDPEVVEHFNACLDRILAIRRQYQDPE